VRMPKVQRYEYVANVDGARRAAPLLRALFGERMVAVNPKAQSCVPLPPGLDLERETDPAALAAFLADDATSSRTRGLSTSDALKRVCFVEDPNRLAAAMDEDQTFDEDGEKDDDDDEETQPDVRCP